jgi:hypothetical protein
MEQPIRHVEALEETPEKTLGRRELLKVLAAAGGAVAASSLLPGEWAKPVVEVGVLPAHAQVSGVLLSITTCSTAPIPPDEVILGDSTVHTFAVISAARSGIQLRRTMTALFPFPFPINTITGSTDATGTWTPPDFTLPDIQVVPGEEFLTVLWEFVDPNDGVNTCVNHIIGPPD